MTNVVLRVWYATNHTTRDSIPCCDLDEVKTANWMCLPRLLAGLALPDEEKARAIGRKCIKLFEDPNDMPPQATFGRKHTLALRFLDYNFVGDAQECSLRTKRIFVYNLSYKLSGTYNLVNQASKTNMFSQKQIKLAKKQV